MWKKDPEAESPGAGVSLTHDSAPGVQSSDTELGRILNGLLQVHCLVREGALIDGVIWAVQSKKFLNFHSCRAC